MLKGKLHCSTSVYKVMHFIQQTNRHQIDRRWPTNNLSAERQIPKAPQIV